jgi:hypothetical protein
MSHESGAAGVVVAIAVLLQLERLDRWPKARNRPEADRRVAEELRIVRPQPAPTSWTRSSSDLNTTPSQPTSLSF